MRLTRNREERQNVAITLRELDVFVVTILPVTNAGGTCYSGVIVKPESAASPISICRAKGE